MRIVLPNSGNMSNITKTKLTKAAKKKLNFTSLKSYSKQHTISILST